MKALLVDASVFVAALLESNTHHAASRQFFTLLRENEKLPYLVVPATIVLEVANILTKFGRHREARSLPSYFPTLQVVPVDDSFIRQAMPVFARVHLKTADAIVVATAFLWKAHLVSWDRQLLREAKHLIPALTPPEYLKLLR